MTPLARVLPAILLLGLTAVGATMTLGILARDALATSCNYTACDPQWAQDVFVGSLPVIGVVFLSGLALSIVATRTKIHWVPPAVTLVVVAVLCYTSLGLYTGAGPVNP
jgi:hypothetical protein